jgi:hypothetical protein
MLLLLTSGELLQRAQLGFVLEALLEDVDGVLGV